jgi:hypothetical protein
MTDKPVLYLTGNKPTPADIFAMTEALTGRKPTPEERAEVEALYEAEIAPTQ